jgi:hypothetical protein
MKEAKRREAKRNDERACRSKECKGIRAKEGKEIG